MKSDPATSSDPISFPTSGQRRWDVSIIAAILAVAATAAFVSSFGMPSLRAFLMPRFGWAGLTSCLYPLIFLGIYLRKPCPRHLWLAAGMTAVVAILNGLDILQKGTVATVSNVFHDRLHSSYLYSVVPLLLIALYLSAVAWRTRSHVAQQSDGIRPD